MHYAGWRRIFPDLDIPFSIQFNDDIFKGAFSAPFFFIDIPSSLTVLWSACINPAKPVVGNYAIHSYSHCRPLCIRMGVA